MYCVQNCNNEDFRNFFIPNHDWMSFIKMNGTIQANCPYRGTPPFWGGMLMNARGELPSGWWNLEADAPFKVHLFWEGHKVLRNLHLTFDWHYVGQNWCGDSAKFCGLLRTYEFYKKYYLQVHQEKPRCHWLWFCRYLSQRRWTGPKSCRGHRR